MDLKKEIQRLESEANRLQGLVDSARDDSERWVKDTEQQIRGIRSEIKDLKTKL